MAQQTRLRANRIHVADLIAQARKDLERAIKRLSTVEELLVAVGEATKKAKTASDLAKAKPSGYKALPATIRRKANRALSTLEKLAEDIRHQPLDKEERALLVHKRKEGHGKK